MIAEAIKQIEDLASAGIFAAREPKVLTVAERLYWQEPQQDGTWRLVPVEDQPDARPDALGLTSLSGLVAYVKANVDGLALEKTFLHVVSPTQVAPVERLTADFRDRYVVAAANAMPGAAFKFGEYFDPETFIVGLLGTFESGGERDVVLKLVGNLRAEAVRTHQDDGVSQIVTARQGVALAAEVKVPCPVYLAPFRTFGEVAQPVSAFVLRVRGGNPNEVPKVALFEADGGRWRLAAMTAIRAYLESELPDRVVVA